MTFTEQYTSLYAHPTTEQQGHSPNTSTTFRLPSVLMDEHSLANLVARRSSLASADYRLTTIQEPQQVKVFQPRDKDRKSIEPPPVIELNLNDDDPYKNFLSSPYYFMNVTLHENSEGQLAAPAVNLQLAGNLVSSLHKVKDSDNNDVGIFVFQDLSIRKDGEFRLRFNLFELQHGDDGMSASYIKSIDSEPFRVYTSGKCPPPLPSTVLTKHLQEQGIKLRTKKTTHPHGRRARRPEDWSSEMPQQPNHTVALNPISPFNGRSMADSYPNQLAPYGAEMYRRDPYRPTMQPPHDRSYGYPPVTSASPSLFNPEMDPRRSYPQQRSDEPSLKRQRVYPPSSTIAYPSPTAAFPPVTTAYPNIDNRYVLTSTDTDTPSDKPPFTTGEEMTMTVPVSAPASYADTPYSSAYTLNPHPQSQSQSQSQSHQQPRSQEPLSTAYYPERAAAAYLPEPLGRRQMTWSDQAQ